MLEAVGQLASAVIDAPAFPTLLFAWQLWALLSEVLLAATHLKVLLCLGKPIPAKELSTKRWTYFLYDLVSPWVSLASIVTPFVLQALAATVHTSSASNLQGLVSSSSSLQDSCKPLQPPFHPETPGYCSSNNTSAVHQPLALGHINVTIPAAAVYNIHVLPSSDLAAAATAAAAGLPAVTSPLQQLLLLFVGAHAALHLYYIASWHTAHSRNVVQMSASSSMSSRAKQFNLLEVVWFFIGTGYDILTHVVMCGLLLQSLASSYSAFKV